MSHRASIPSPYREFRQGVSMAGSKRVPKVALCAISQPFLALRDDFDAGRVDCRGLESAYVPQSATAHPFLSSHYREFRQGVSMAGG